MLVTFVLLLGGLSACDARLSLQCKQALDLAQRIAVGDRNFCTRQAQTRLKELGYGSSVRVDGSFGEETRKAVEAFQKAKGLPVTGHAGLQDLERMFETEEKEL